MPLLRKFICKKIRKTREVSSTQTLKYKYKYLVFTASASQVGLRKCWRKHTKYNQQLELLFYLLTSLYVETAQLHR